MAPKTRAYTKEELQSLRRADLQRLCKTYDIKGANAKSDALIDTLVQYFNSPAYLASPKPESSRVRPVPRNAATRPIHTLPPRAPKSRPISSSAVVRPVANRRPESAPVRSAGSANPRTAVPSSSSASLGDAAAAATSTGATTTSDSAVPESTTQPSMRPLRPGEVRPAAQLPEDLGNLDVEGNSILRRDMALLQASVAALEKNQSEEALAARIDRQITGVIQRHLALLEEREAAVRRREEALDEAWSRLERAIASQSATAQSPPPTSNRLSGKRKSRACSPEGAPLPKRVRSGEGSSHIGDSSAVRAPRSQGVPRTPSPPHQKRGSVEEQQMPQPPGFATTPKAPGEPQSPTTGRSSANEGPPPPPHGRERPHHDRSRRKVSQAHIDLSAITGSRDAPDTPPFLGPIVIHKRPVSPSALSPSPSIGGDAFSSYSSLPRPPNARPIEDKSTSERLSRSEFSPGREYMNVALNGLWDPDASPSAHATPSSRTMIGTERFRDRRFADEVELVPWDTPKVDFGPSAGQ